MTLSDDHPKTKPGLPASPTAEDLHAYVEQLYDRATRRSRVGLVQDYRAATRSKSKHEITQSAVFKAKRELFSFNAEVGTAHRRCSATTKRGTKCRMIAVRGMAVCYFHGGKAEVHRRNRLEGVPSLERTRALNTVDRSLARQGLLPRELLAHPLFRQINAAFKDQGPATRYLKAGLIRAWFAQQAGDADAWPRAVLICRKAGFTGEI